MAQKFYLPNGDADRGTWMENFNTKLPNYATLLGITKPQTDSVAADTLGFRYGLELVAGAKTFEHQCTTFKTALRDGPASTIALAIPVFVAPANPPAAVAPGIFSRVARLVKTIKANSAYTETIGKDLGIIGADPGSDVWDDEQPVLTAKVSGGQVQLKYVKGDADGIQLESKRGTETTFTLLDKITKTTYTDTRANLVAGQPEQRQYRAWFIVDDEIVGQVSAVITVVVGA